MHAELVGRISEAVWSMDSQYLNGYMNGYQFTYVPSQSPILKTVVPVFTDPEILFDVVDPAVTVTEEVATAYSP